MKSILFTNLLVLMMSMCLFAQDHERIQNMHSCGHTDGLSELYKNNPEAKERAEKAEAAFVARLKEKIAAGDESMFKTTAATIRIPVVFHVIYGDCDDGNVPKDRIDTAMEQLNRDFQGLNGQDPNLVYDDRVGSMDIEFFLAERDLNGNPTTGITRTESALTYAGLGDSYKLRELVMWPRNTYLNMYVVKQINSTGSSGIANYPKDSQGQSSNRDGVALADWAVGPRPGEYRENYNTIISHEVGHWLGLRHIWGDRVAEELHSSCSIDDFSHLSSAMNQYVTDVDNPDPNYPQSVFNDTPNTIGNSIIWSDPTCLASGTTNNCGGAGTDVDMLENIMDYTGCAVMFTKGQIKYMDFVLNDPTAERNLIAVNAPNATLGNQSRVVFQETTLKENTLNNGTIANTLDIKLVNAGFTSPSPGNALTQGTHYNITWPVGFNANNLQVSIVRSATELDKATLQITGSTTTHANDIEFTIVFQNTLFNTSITAPNRTKTLKIDFVESAGVIHNNQTYDMYIGPEGRSYDRAYVKPNYGIGFRYIADLSNYYIFIEIPAIQIATLPNGNVQTLTNLNTIPANTNTFSDGTNYPGILLDVASITSGQEFYIPFRIGCLPNYSYGWIRAEKDISCNRIKIMDTFLNTTIGQSVTVGNVGSPKVIYDTSIMKESSSGTFNTLQIELKGSLPSGKGFKNTISSSDFSIASVNNGALPSDFTASDLSISVNSLTKATISLTTPPDMSQDFKFQIIFNPSAFVSGTPTIDAGQHPIQVDYINTSVITYSSGNVVFHRPIEYISLNTISSNNSNHPLGIQAINEGYLFFVNPDNYPFVAKIVCKTANSPEVRLFSCGDATNNLDFRPMGEGLNASSTSIVDQVYVSTNDLLNWPDDFAYVLLEYDLGCGESLTAWAKLDLSDPNSITLVEVALSEDPSSIIELCYKGPCDPLLLPDTDELQRLYIENVGTGGVQNPSTTSNNAYQDHTNVVLPLQVGNNLVNFTQGNGQDSNGTQFPPTPNPYWYVFIDFNENGYFDTEELMLTHQGQDVQQYLNYIDPSTPFGTYKMRIVLSVYDLTVYNVNYVCNTHFGLVNGETEDYTVNLSNSPACTDADNDNVCANVDCDDNDASIGVTQTPGTACDDGNPNNSNDVILTDGCTCQGSTPPPTSGYCTPDIPTHSNNNFISNVTLEEINNTSGNDGYGDFTAGTAANLVHSNDYTLYAYKPTDDGSLFYWSAWVDYNQDGDFDDAGELIFDRVHESDYYITETFNVPENALIGTTRMRIHLKQYIGQPPVPCGNNDNVDAEIEDYTINISNTPTYCTPDVTSSANNYITGVVIVGGGLSSGSVNDGGYRDFTTDIAPGNILPEDTYTLNLYKELDNNVNQYWRVWIDYNQDGIFDDNTELVVSEWPVSDNILTRTFTVPAGTPNGRTRMRVYLKDYVGQPPLSCGNNDNVSADVEDYAIIIGEDDCQPFYSLSGTINTNIFRAQDYIQSDGQVPAGNTVTFQAGNYVRLLPGFIATAGTTSKFHALIDDCTATSPKEEIAESEPAIRNYPNPFTGQTTIEFTLPEDSDVTLSVSDAMGRRVAVLVNNETNIAGTHQVIFDGNRYAAGMYYYTLQAGEYSSTQKMILIK